MRVFPKSPKDWNQAAFRLAFSFVALVIALVGGIHIYAGVSFHYIYINGLFYVLRDWESAGRTVAPMAGIILLFWSYFLLRAPVRFRNIRYAFAGIPLSLLAIALFWCGPFPMAK